MSRVFRLSLFTLFIAIAVSALSVPEARAQGVLNEILKRMDAHNDALVTLRANVRMAKTNTQLRITTTQDGEVFYANEGGKKVNVRINWTDPEEILSVVDGKYTLYRPRLKQAITGKTEGSKNAQANNALGFMKMSKKELTDNYDVKYLGNASLSGKEVWHLGLYPKKPQSYKSAELWVDGDGMPLQAKVLEKNSDVTTVLLSNLKKNVKMTRDMFELKVPKDVKMIDG